MDLRFETTDLALYEGEPRIADVKLAAVLGYGRERDIRKLIERITPELESYGPIACQRATVARSQGGGSSSDQFFLNEGQALVVCSLSRTSLAAQVRRALIEVFMAWRRGALAPQTVALASTAQSHRIRAAKLRFAEAATTLDALGVDVTAINLNAVLAFGRAVLR